MNRLTKLLGPIATAIVLMLATVPSALAHAHPKVMNPAPDSSGPARTRSRLRFLEGVEPKFSFIQLTDENGKSAQYGTLQTGARQRPNHPDSLCSEAGAGNLHCSLGQCGR